MPESSVDGTHFSENMMQKFKNVAQSQEFKGTEEEQNLFTDRQKTGRDASIARMTNASQMTSKRKNSSLG